MSRSTILVDSFGRRMNYLRISLTDRCNFRCVYCMPQEAPPVLSSKDILTRSEITRFVDIVSRLGIERIRLTGGEPLLREDILDIVRDIGGMKAINDLSMTTNASRLLPYVKPLKEAGLRRINISLDSLDPLGFQQVTRVNSYENVIHSIIAALDEGFPLKLNMVVLKGMNDHEILPFARLAFDYPLEIRFLEFMPLCGLNWQRDLFLGIAQIRNIVQENFQLLSASENGGHVAETYRIKGGQGRIGFIGSLTEPFCSSCSRLRLTSDGKIRPCLFSNEEVSVKMLLKENRPEEEIISAVLHAVRIKPSGNPFYKKPYQMNQTLSFASVSTPLIRSIGG